MNDRPLSGRRPLGRSELQVSPLCLGGNVFLAQPAVVAPIASATSAEQLGELIGFTRLRLDPADLSELQAP